MSCRQLQKPTLVAFVFNGTRPLSRSNSTPFITLDGKLKHNQFLNGTLIPYLNKIASLTESAIGKSLYSLQVGLVPKNTELFLIIDLINMKLLVKPELVDLLLDGHDEFTQVLENVVQSIPKELTLDTLNKFMYNMPMIIRQSVWICITCIIILGIGLPLGWNYGLYLLSEQICKYYSLSPQDCAELGIDMVLLGNILILPAAWIIFKVCNLSTCGKAAATLVSSLLK
jgi:hypothetical protein